MSVGHTNGLLHRLGLIYGFGGFLLVELVEVDLLG
jgi:hypothetical protein